MGAAGNSKMGAGGNSTTSRHSNLQAAAIHPGWAIFFVVLLVAVLIILIVVRRRWSVAIDVDEGRDRTGSSAKRRKPNGGTNNLWGHTGEITFCDSEKQGLYTLRFVLRSSVEMLGRGCLGATYKLIVGHGCLIALKRLEMVDMKQKEFEQHMRKLGKLNKKNILSLQSFYYANKALKFVVYDYLCLGSVDSLLQGGKLLNHTPLDWQIRCTIAFDVACALRHLHKHHVIHGNLKSSNVFLDTGFCTVVSEYGLVQMTSPALAHCATVGYRAPELADATIPTPASDVYSYGVFLLELLTGRSPCSHPTPSSSCSCPGGAVDHELPQWVKKTMLEKPLEDVFDPELRSTLRLFDRAVTQLLHVADTCVSTSADARPGMEKVVDMLRDIMKTCGSVQQLMKDHSMFASDCETSSDSESYTISISKHMQSAHQSDED